MVSLKKFLSKRNEASQLILSHSEALDVPIKIFDLEENLILESHPKRAIGPKKFPIIINDFYLGSVQGDKKSVTHLVRAEISQKQMAVEILDRYRELNLLYNLSEKLCAAFSLSSVAKIALDEAGRLIEGEDGLVVLIKEQIETPQIISTFGERFQTSKQFPQFLLKLTLGGEDEIVNNIPVVYSEENETFGINSLICAPLKVKDKFIGMIFLCSNVVDSYSAGDLKLLNCLAPQAATAIENAITYERLMREAEEREQRLKEQIIALQIELDEAQQKKQVDEITETDYFKQIRSQADQLRKIIQENTKTSIS